MKKHHWVKSRVKYPFWFKTPLILIGLSLFVVILSYGKFILMPLAFSAFIAMMLNPIIRKFESWRMGRAASIIILLTLLVVLLSGVLTLFTTQFVQFADRIPEVTEKLKSLSANGLTFLEETVEISEEQQTEYIQKGVDKLIDSSGNFFSSILTLTTDAFKVFGLLPIFIFFMLYYKEMYLVFFKKVLQNKSSHSEVEDLIERVQEVTQNYLVGLLSVIGILAILNTTGLFIIGLEHAIFFGVFASLLAVIPYIGIIIGALPPLLFALLLGDSLLTPVFVVIVFAVVQFLEGNFISPKIVGSKVSINPFVAIIALIVGGEIWGVAGMILFVPLIGILRVIFSEIQDLKPYGYLLGNTKGYED